MSPLWMAVLFLGLLSFALLIAAAGFAFLSYRFSRDIQALRQTYVLKRTQEELDALQASHNFLGAVREFETSD